MVAQEVGLLPPQELASLAKTEVNEDPERLAADLQAIKDWLSKQPHLQNIRSGISQFSTVLSKCVPRVQFVPIFR